MEISGAFWKRPDFHGGLSDLSPVSSDFTIRSRGPELSWNSHRNRTIVKASWNRFLIDNHHQIYSEYAAHVEFWYWFAFWEAPNSRFNAYLGMIIYLLDALFCCTYITLNLSAVQNPQKNLQKQLRDRLVFCLVVVVILCPTWGFQVLPRRVATTKGLCGFGRWLGVEGSLSNTIELKSLAAQGWWSPCWRKKSQEDPRAIDHHPQICS